MPPKKPAAVSAEPPGQTSSDARPLEEKKPDAAAQRKPAAHPSTAIMVKEALTELDSRKGVSSHAMQSYIKQKYPSVDVMRLKHLVRRALKKGLETGTLVRPANSSVATGATGKFRLAPKVKETKPKTENTDPNVQKLPKAAKDGAKKPPKAGATKKRDPAKEQAKSQEDSKPPRKSKKDQEAVTSTKVVPAKKPKAKKVAEDFEGAANSAKTKAKATKKAKAPQSKAAAAGTASKATGKRGRKTAD